MSDREDRIRLFRSLLPLMYEKGNIQQLTRTEETEPVLIEIITDAFEIGMNYQQQLASFDTFQKDS